MTDRAPWLCLICAFCKMVIMLELQGYTKVGLYGLGNVRDERLGRMFQTPGCVEW